MAGYSGGGHADTGYADAGHADTGYADAGYGKPRVTVENEYFQYFYWGLLK